MKLNISLFLISPFLKLFVYKIYDEHKIVIMLWIEKTYEYMYTMNSHLGISKYEQYQNKEFSICNKYKGIGVCIHCVCKYRNMIIPINYTNKPNLFFHPFSWNLDLSKYFVKIVIVKNSIIMSMILNDQLLSL